MTMSDYFQYREDRLFVENIPLTDIAKRFGTPCYVYSRAALTDGYRSFDEALAGRDHLICYAVKANSSLAILNLFARMGAGFDIVSGGELQRVLAAGGDAGKVVFSGVGKTAEEMRQALEAGILCFNVESEAELVRLDEVAREIGRTAPISLRVNPDVDPKTHPYISTGLKQSKFGVAYADALALYRKAAGMPGLRITGLDCHIGSQLTEASPIVAAAEKVLALADALVREGIILEHLDLGGGLGIRYRDETPPSIAEYAAALKGVMQGRREKLLVEPGRALVGNAGVLLTRVEYLKHGAEKHFAIVDAAMNDLMRPALYDAYHEILPVNRETGVAAPPQIPSPQSSGGTTSQSTKPASGQVAGYPASGRGGERERQSLTYEVVGPVCESGDFLGRDRELSIIQGDVLSVMSAGAYGMSMSSNYNTRPRVAEVMVDGDIAKVIRERETVEQLFAGEHLPF
jgi:diaminopimelate decarboxylase